MARPELLRRVPGLSAAAAAILDPARGPLERAIRSEIFGPERFAQHGHSLAETHAARYAPSGSTAFFPRLRDNVRILREAHHYIGAQATTGHDVSTAAEWLLDNFHVVEAQLREIRQGLPRRYFRDLPILQDEPLVGLPRVYGIAWAFVAHTDSAFDEELLVHFLKAYEQTRELTLGELWALPTTLRVVLIENLRRLAERTAAFEAASELANLCSDRIGSTPLEQLDGLLALLNRRGAGEPFLAQMAQRLQDGPATADPRYGDWIRRVAPHLAEIQTRLPAAQAADNLSVGNAITSLRSIGDADWPDIVAETSTLTRLMLTSPAFVAERDDTRDATLHAIEALARRSGRGEPEVAETLLSYTHRRAAPGGAGGGDADPTRVADHWLQGTGRTEFLAALGLDDRLAAHWRRFRHRAALPVYLGAIASASVGVVAWMLWQNTLAMPFTPLAPWLTAVAAALLLIPASEAVVAVVNRLISESTAPSRLPRLALASGIPPEHRVIVVIPAILPAPAAAAALGHQLELHHLANPERHAQFALLTDFADAASAQTDADAAVLAAAQREIARLNALHPAPHGDAARFLLLHRERRFSESEQRWMGWERKRGKLEQLVAVLAGASGAASPFLDLGRASALAPGTRYLVTLDSDTRLPPGRLRDLVGVAAHPHNAPRLSADGRRVEHGYGILQPRVATPLPAPQDMTLYHWLFSGLPGIDPYSAAISEVYQDVFGEGTFTGKGLLHVQAVHAVLAGRLPDNQILSHDLLEGSLARCATVTDITVIEEAPFHADVAASRIHRWTRGDWQLLPVLLNAGHYGIRAINRWKMLDNLRRSLVAPASVALLGYALAISVVSPAATLLLIALAYSAGPLMGALAAFAPSRDDIAKAHFYAQAVDDLGRALLSGAWQLAQLMQFALMATDAIVRALFRMLVSRRHLLEWTTAAAAQASVTTRLPALLRKHWAAPLASLAFWLVELGLGARQMPLATVLCAIWALSAVWTWWASRPEPARRADTLSPADRAYLADVARDSWRLFERCVGPGDRNLPPDNLQTAPHDMVAHRTSPTNIGLYLLATVCAREFGWIGRSDTAARLEATLATLAGMERHHGHFLNWYDTETARALLPMYLSTVDSGNLCVHLLAVARACLALAAAPDDDAAPRAALAASAARIARLRAESGVELAGPLDELLALADPLGALTASPPGLRGLLDHAAAELAGETPPREPETPATAPLRLAWALEDHLAILRSAERDADPGGDTQARLGAIAATCQRLAREARFGFLYDRKRRLFHIGYRVAEQQLDAGYYDLLASEARATSLWAIAKGDVPAQHWAALGRPFFAVGTRAGLRSWSGSMFEYLMPSLVLDEPFGSVLHGAAQVAVAEQIAYGRERHVPWGISESAYAGSDQTLAYQYAPQGVPRLALRRTPLDELVVAPYATALAAQVTPHRAVANLRRFESRQARDRYGFIEALDYSPGRQSGSEGFACVRTFMAHHQGMTIVALANVLLAGCSRRWGMADPRIEAVASLLQERTPREVPALATPPPGALPAMRPRRAPGLVRDVAPERSALGPTHLLSNGRYAVALRANGAGASRWGRFTVSRWRDDALRDAWGTFLYLRSERRPHAVSMTQHPAADAAAHYRSTFLADRVCFMASWPELEATTTVWVSPEDDLEFRQVDLRNLDDRDAEIELISAFEVTLAEARADAAHPAFSNLFVTAAWDAAHQALLFERKPRLATESGVHAAHFLVAGDTPGLSLRIQVDRARWLGRNRDASGPLAALEEPPAAPEGAAGNEPTPLVTGLDPVAAIAARIRLPARSKVRLTFCTAAADSAMTLRAVIDKYRQPSNVERASMMSATLTGIRLRETRLGAEKLAAIQTLTTALALTLARPQSIAAEALETCDRRLLWRFGISGDRPIVLVSAGVAQGLGLLRTLAQALRLWSWGGIACDLVVVNHEPVSYLMALSRPIQALRDAYLADCKADPGVAEAGFHLIASADLHADELATLRALARIRLNADGRPIEHHADELVELHERSLGERQAGSTAQLPTASSAEIVPAAPEGDFATVSGEFRFDVSVLLRPARPWTNVLANPGFGALLTEAGGGYSWAVNSSLNQLTAWSNDPVADSCAEWFVLQDLRTSQCWSITPSAAADRQVRYRVAYGQGYATISHRRDSLEVGATWCVDPELSVKQVRVRLTNRGHRTQALRIVGLVEWMMGAELGDRATTVTSMARHAAASPGDAGDMGSMTTLFCTQRERSAGFGSGTAFFGLAGDAGNAGDADDAIDWTCDRSESFDAHGRVVVPERYRRSSGCGLDPCAALALPVELRAGESREAVFLLGYGPDPDTARTLAERAARVLPLARLQAERERWDSLLGAVAVSTPDPLFDILVNRWLLYQTVACRLWAKAGFYQAGGAYGFRDQLQDAMALAWAAPERLREQIVLSASRQFPEGDVQHWWHPPTGAGVRTRFSDDLLWLVHATLRYLETSGDATLLDRAVPFIEGAAIAEGAEDAYYVPTVSTQTATVFEHCARTIDRSLTAGAHGLPLMGSGDWNDGMNRVGHEGRGESVWLAWFLCDLVARFAPVAEQRGETERAARWRAAADGWRDALEEAGWDGAWYRRAYFDDGSPLGSAANEECRIDLLAQAWAVLSGAAPRARADRAMAALEERLVDAEAGLIRLLDPPLADAQPSAGYIQAYPPGVRENGGQYSHAGVWALMAQAARGDGDSAYRYFTCLSPAHRARDPARAPAYAIEPFVMAGDVYSAPPYVGRGGWSWYTGSAAWMHRAAVESILGLRQRGGEIALVPCLPGHWEHAEISLSRAGRTLRVVIARDAPGAPDPAPLRRLAPGEWLVWSGLEPGAVRSMRLPRPAPAAPEPRAARARAG